MKKVVFAVFSVLMMLVICSCRANVTFEEGQKAAPTGDTKWSVMIYACGDNGGKASQIIEELTKREYPENVNVVMQTGGSSDWELDYIDGTFLQRYEMQKGKVFLKDQKQGASMGDYEVFSDFIKWGTQNYPADKNILIILGEGTGMEICSDSIYGGDTLNVEELYYGLSLNNTIMDAICFDGGYMSSLEVATALPNYAKYMVASEEKCAGYDYGRLVDCIIEYPQADVSEICNDMCKAYVEKCEKEGMAAVAQISLINLMQISHLNQAFDGMAREMLLQTQSLDNLGALTRMLETAQRCAGSEMTDIGSMAEAVKDISAETSSIVQEAISKAVMYNAKGTMREESSGISVYYPLNVNEDELNEYMKYSLSDNYKEYLKSTIPQVNIVDEYISNDYSDTTAWAQYSGQEMLVDGVVEGDKYTMYINGSKNILKNVALNRYINKGGKYYSCGNSMELECYWEENKYQSALNSNVPVIKGDAANARLISVNDSYSIYSVPILFNSKNAEIYVSYSKASGKYSYLGIWCDEKFEKGSLGDNVTLLRTEKDTGNIVADKAFNVFFGINVKTSSLPSGEYALEYEAEDIYRNKTLTQLSDLSI